MQSIRYIKDAAFPVYVLGKRCPEVDNGVLFYQYRLKEGITLKVIDDKNLEGDTLAKRRLQIKENKHTLSKALFFLADLLKYASPATYFIDSNGKVFKYIKSTSAKLTFKKITAVHRIAMGALIEVEGLPGRYKCLFAPVEGQEYAGMLKVATRSYILYGLYDKQYKDTIRKV